MIQYHGAAQAVQIEEVPSKAREWTGVHDRAGGGADNELGGNEWRPTAC
jgi:hypothetical protein